MQTNLPSRTRLISCLTGALFCLLVLLATGGRADDAAPTGPDAVSKQAHNEPDWMPHPDKPRQFSPEELAFIKKCADNERMEFDPERNLIITRLNWGVPIPPSGFIRASIGYATVLFDSGDEAYLQRALRILEATLPFQHVHPGCKVHGNFPKFVEANVDEMLKSGEHVDGNQADFIAWMLQRILYRHEDRLPEKVKEQIKEALLLSADYIKSRSIGPAYTNAYYMGIANLIGIGERYDRPDLVEAGLEHLRKMHELVFDQGSYTEYQCPGYTTLVLNVLYDMLGWVRTPEAREKGIELYNETWRQIATQYHPPSQQWAGPQLRNGNSKGDGGFTDSSISNIIRNAVEGSAGVPPESMEPSDDTLGLVLRHHRVPDHLRHFFLVLPEPRQVVQHYWKMTPVSKKYVSEGNEKTLSVDTIGTTYLHPDFALGTVNRGHIGPSRCGILAHWGTPDNVGYMNVQLYKNNIPFCVPQHFAVQDKGRALYVLNFSTNGGDVHWNRDRIDGTFRAKDLRMRIDFLGIGKSAKLRILGKDKGIAEVQSGDVTIRIHVPVALFNGKPVAMRLGRPLKDRQILEIVFHTGDDTEFDLRTFKDSAVGLALAVDSGANKTSFTNLKSDIVDHRLNMDWDGLKLSIPTIPKTDEELHTSFEASVNGESRKILNQKN